MFWTLVEDWGAQLSNCVQDKNIEVIPWICLFTLTFIDAEGYCINPGSDMAVCVCLSNSRSTFCGDALRGFVLSISAVPTGCPFYLGFYFLSVFVSLRLFPPALTVNLSLVFCRSVLWLVLIMRSSEVFGFLLVLPLFCECSKTFWIVLV